MNQYRDAVISSEQMQIIKKFDDAVNYLYPIMQSAPRNQGVLRDKILNALFEQVEMFITAGKSKQKSKLYMCDAGLSNLRYLIRFATHPTRKLLSKRQHQVALVKLSECGAMLNAWIKKAQ
ncbi:MAG: diversity-generating retroelement protein Avd [Vibrio sp.]|uniref:diversity-generating retroelement protein Avd n=1 Tax=Vibrio sp. TaxID=678 RepID=UPI003F2DDA25